MGLFDFFKSDEEKVRFKIRKGFDGCVRTAVKSAGTNEREFDVRKVLKKLWEWVFVCNSLIITYKVTKNIPFPQLF